MNFKYLNFHKQKGLTLVELLIASVLGLLLVGIIGSMYVTSVGGFRTTKELSRIQENTRFAMYYIQQSLREAGYSECGGTSRTKEYSYLLDNANSTINGGILGWEFNGTDNGETLVLTYADLGPDSTDAEVTTAETANTATLASWSSITGAPDLTELITDYKPMAGSDIIAVTTEQFRSDISVTGAGTSTVSNTITVAAASTPLPQGAIVKIGDCVERNIFSKTNISTATGVIAGDSGSGNIDASTRPGSDFFTQAWGADARVYTDVTTFYFVGTGASGLPALFRVESQCGFQLSTCETTPVNGVEAVELVEGVETMQIMYGVDSDDDGVANQYFSADTIGSDFTDVVTLRVSLLMRSNENSEVVDSAVYELADVVTIDPIDKPVLRYVVNSTIELRNREDP